MKFAVRCLGNRDADSQWPRGGGQQGKRSKINVSQNTFNNMCRNPTSQLNFVYSFPNICSFIFDLLQCTLIWEKQWIKEKMTQII